MQSGFVDFGENINNWSFAEKTFVKQSLSIVFKSVVGKADYG